MESIWDINFRDTNQLAKLEKLLSCGVNPNEARDFDGVIETPLFVACAGHQKAMVKLLLKFGADPNYLSSVAGTPLHVAVCVKDIELSKLLIDNGADVNLLREYSLLPFLPKNLKSSPISVASKRGYLEIVKLLLERGCNPNIYISYGSNTPLGFSAENGHLDVMMALLEGGADPSYQGEGWFGTSPLFTAVVENQLEAVKLLVEAGADINSHNGLLGATPLHAAQHLQRDPEIRQYLIEHRAVARLYPVVEILVLFGIVTY
jgi:ankyrin repeat protein